MQQQQDQTLTKIGQMVAQLEAGKTRTPRPFIGYTSRLMTLKSNNSLDSWKTERRPPPNHWLKLKSWCGVTGMVTSTTKM